MLPPQLVRGLHTTAALLRSGPSKRKFVDRVRLQVTGGRGGRGVVSFEPLGGRKKRAVGGHGGKGGDVVLQASQAVADLSLRSFVVKGGNGGDASGKGKNGAKGKTVKVLVPCGTIVKDIVRTYDYSAELPAEYLGTASAEESGLEGEEEEEPDVDNADFEGWSSEDSGDEWESDSDEDIPRSAFNMPKAARRELLRLSGRVNFVDSVTTLGELDTHKASMMVAAGGTPGYGNRHLQRGEETPETPHIVGVAGQHRFLQLEMKGIADVGLVGFPNAGKSSLLRRLSRAKPKVAAYPFTTLHPILGVVKFQDTMSLTVADIPGIIEGAHANRGLGHEFLRHIQRTQVLLYVVDSCSHTGAAHDLRCLQEELALFDDNLPKRPSLVVANKADLPAAEAGVAELRASTLMPVIPISALDGRNIGTVVDSMRWLLEQQAKAAQSNVIRTATTPAFRV